MEFVLNVLERLAERYGCRTGLWGIEVINEPILSDMWEIMNVTERYPAADPKKAEGSGPNTMEFIRQFYLDAYDRVLIYLPAEKYIVIHDAFNLGAWKDLMQEEKYTNVVLDTHQYLMFAEMKGCEQNVEGYVNYIKEHYEDEIRKMQEYFPVICGEWCLFDSLAVGCDTRGGQSVLNQCLLLKSLLYNLLRESLMHIRLLWNTFGPIILKRNNKITLSVVLNMNIKKMERYIWMFIFMLMCDDGLAWNG